MFNNKNVFLNMKLHQIWILNKAIYVPMTKLLLTCKVRTIGTCHVVAVSKSIQISGQYSMKSCKFNSIPESLSITINVKLDSRNVGSQCLSTLPVATESVENKCTVIFNKLSSSERYILWFQGIGWGNSISHYLHQIWLGRVLCTEVDGRCWNLHIRCDLMLNILSTGQ